VHDHFVYEKPTPAWLTIKMGTAQALPMTIHATLYCSVCTKRATHTPEVAKKLWLAKQGKALDLESDTIAAMM
jgi:hypothetical protein